MQATVPLKELRAAVKAACKAIGRNPKIPTLTRLCLTAWDTTLTVRGTDLDVDMATQLAATNVTPGTVMKVLIGAKQLAAVLANMPGDAVTLSATGGDKMLIAHARGTFSIEAFDEVDYPPAPAPMAATATLPAAAFAKALAKVMPFVSTDQTRYVINGIFVELGGDACALVATDGRRMARQAFPLPGAFTADCIIPQSALPLLVAMCRAGKMLTLAIPATVEKGARLEFTNGAATLSCRVVEGTYPNYKQVIPTALANVATFDRRDLIAGVQCVAAMCTKEAYRSGVKLALSAAGATITAKGALPGMSAEWRMAVEYKGKPCAMELNAGFVLTALRVMGDDRASLNFNDEFRQVTFADVDCGWTCVIMPMRG